MVLPNRDTHKRNRERFNGNAHRCWISSFSPNLLGSPRECQPACKPGFVWRAVSLARVMAIPLGRPLPAASSNQPGQRSGDGSKDFSGEKHLASPLFGFAPGGACHAAHVAMRAVRSYRTVSPLPCGGLFSVALSLGLPPPEVIRHRVSVEPGLSSATTAVAIQPTGQSHIGALRQFVNC
jgi:hypothetical protein